MWVKVLWSKFPYEMFMIFKANHLQLTTVSGIYESNIRREVKDTTCVYSPQRSLSFFISYSGSKKERKNMIICVFWQRKIERSTSSLSESV